MEDFFSFFVTSALQFDPRKALARYFIGRRLAHLPLFYQTIFRTWQALDGGLFLFLWIIFLLGPSPAFYRKRLMLSLVVRLTFALHMVSCTGPSVDEL